MLSIFIYIRKIGGLTCESLLCKSALLSSCKSYKCCVKASQAYAKAMMKLATEHWDKNNLNSSSLCRIQWVVDKCNDYFKNGGMGMAIEKENRFYRKFFCEDFSSNQLTINGDFQIDGNRLTLLDVGSCYNPFKNYGDFYTIAIDLVPATDDVIKCDFLSVDILSGKTLSDIVNPCKFLPGNSFNIVVFSLLLEYLPSPKQRWICCQKAYQVLKTNGLLIILTPDSKHATANSQVIKQWRYALADIGFLLVCYEKLKHLHCLMYRKSINRNVPKKWLSLQEKSSREPMNREEMICIPQDFHEYTKEPNCSQIQEVRSDTNNEFIAHSFTELPDTQFDLFG